MFNMMQIEDTCQMWQKGSWLDVWSMLKLYNMIRQISVHKVGGWLSNISVCNLTKEMRLYTKVKTSYPIEQRKGHFKAWKMFFWCSSFYKSNIFLNLNTTSNYIIWRSTPQIQFSLDESKACSFRLITWDYLTCSVWLFAASDK